MDRIEATKRMIEVHNKIRLLSPEDAENVLTEFALSNPTYSVTTTKKGSIFFQDFKSGFKIKDNNSHKVLLALCMINMEGIHYRRTVKSIILLYNK